MQTTLNSKHIFLTYETVVSAERESETNNVEGHASNASIQQVLNQNVLSVLHGHCAHFH